MSLLSGQNTAERSSSLGLAVRRIQVTKLFGIYTYDLKLEPDQWAYDPDLMILYGDNGSGKTTILRLVFHLVSPARGAGHRTYLAQVPFQDFRVSLSDGTVIAAVRSPDTQDGPYSYQVSKGSSKLFDHHFLVDADGDLIFEDPETMDNYERLIAYLGQLNLQFHYLGDDRKVATDDTSDKRNLRRYLRREDISYSYIASRNALLHRELEDSDDNLQQAVSRAEGFVRREAFARSTRGSENANTVYTQVIQRLVSSPDFESNESPNDLSELREKIAKILSRNKSFEDLGLSAPLNLGQIQDVLSKSPQQFETLIVDILEPYIDGINARLDALQTLHDVMLTFSGHLNEFYANKRVRLHLNDGVQILAATDQVLEVDKLSSGEKQLLLLMCNAISARDEASVLIIDEPEISLNVKWQRQLIRALLDCMKGSSAQFLLATHSLEIVSQYSNNLVRLDNLNEGYAE